MDTKELSSALANFTGSDNYYQHSLFRLKYTSGVKFLVDQAQAYWLIDLVLSYQNWRFRTKHQFQIWRLKPGRKYAAVAVCEDGNGKVLRRQSIPYTDFPLELDIKLYFENEVLCLPSER
jgi:hypothetical protein